MVVNPRILLLDEPLSNLDALLRDELRNEIRQLQQRLNLTSIFVTHDQEEALVLSDRIVVMNQGEIEQIGTPTEIFDSPESFFTADFMGVKNIFEGNANQDIFITKNGLEIIIMEDEKIKGIGIRPNRIVVNPKEKSMYQNQHKVKVENKIYKGTVIELTVLFETGDEMVVEIPSEKHISSSINEDTEILLYWSSESIIPLYS